MYEDRTQKPKLFKPISTAVISHCPIIVTVMFITCVILTHSVVSTSG